MKNIRLNNGVEMPQLGYGVFQVSPEECEKCVSDAIAAGYRSIDTAQVYGNEEGVATPSREAVPTAKSFLSLLRCGFPTSVTKRRRRLIFKQYVCFMIVESTHLPFQQGFGEK